MHSKIRVGLVESNRLFRDHLTKALKQQSDITVVFSVPSFSNISTTSSLDVVLVQCSHCEINLLDKFTENLKGAKIIGINVGLDKLNILTYVRLGFAGFVLEDSILDDLMSAIRTVVAGEYAMPAPAMRTLLQQLRQTQIHTLSSTAKAERITNRQREIATLVLEGLSNKEIALRLNIAVDTVKTHVHTLLEKLGFHSRIDLINHTWKNGFADIKSKGAPQRLVG